MHALSTVLVTKKAFAVVIASTAILGGGMIAEASQMTAAGTGHASTRVASHAGADTALDAIASIRADIQAGSGLKTALGGITRHGAAGQTDVRVDLGAEDQHDVSLGARLRAEAHNRIGSMKEFVLGLLGIQTGAQVVVGDGTETARTAVTTTNANPASQSGIATAVGAIGSGQSHAALASHAETDATVGLSTALDAITSATTEGSAGANLTALSTANGPDGGTGGSTSGSAGLRLGLSGTR